MSRQCKRVNVISFSKYIPFRFICILKTTARPRRMCSVEVCGSEGGRGADAGAGKGNTICRLPAGRGHTSAAASRGASLSAPHHVALIVRPRGIGDTWQPCGVKGGMALYGTDGGSGGGDSTDDGVS